MPSENAVSAQLMATLLRFSGRAEVAGFDVTREQTMLFPLTMITNTFADPSTLPAWLGTIAEWNPLSATVTAIRELFGNPGVPGNDHALLLAIAWPLLIVAVFFPVAVSKYRRLSV